MGKTGQDNLFFSVQLCRRIGIEEIDIDKEIHCKYERKTLLTAK